MPGIRHKIVKGSVWITASRLVGNTLTALSNIVLAAFLTPDQFGLVFIAISLLTIFVSFTELSLSYSLIALKDVEEDHYHTAWTLGVIRGLLLAIILSALSPAIADFFNDTRLIPIVVAISAVPVLSSLRSPLLARLEKELSFHQIFYMDVVGSIGAFVFALVIAVMFKSYWALVAAQFGGAIVSVILSYVLMPYVPKLTVKKWRDMLSFSVWLSLAQIVGILNYRVDQLVVGALLGKGELGLYTMGGRLAQLPGREVTRPLTRTLFPAYATAVDDPDRLQSLYRRSQNIVFAFAFPATVGICLIADVFVTRLMNPSWLPVIPVVQIMAVATSIETLGSLANPLAMASKQTRLLLIRDVQKFFIRIPLLLVGAWVGGFMGVIYARAIAAIIGVTIDMMVVRRAISLSLTKQILDNVRPILASTAMIVAVLFARTMVPYPPNLFMFVIWLAGISIFGASIYFISLFALWFGHRRPQGAESEIYTIVRQQFARRRDKWR